MDAGQKMSNEEIQDRIEQGGKKLVERAIENRKLQKGDRIRVNEFIYKVIAARPDGKCTLKLMSN